MEDANPFDVNKTEIRRFYNEEMSMLKTCQKMMYFFLNRQFREH